MAEEMVTITKKEYESLIRDSKLLTALEDAGVDNWDWYSDAYQAAFGEDEED